MKTEDVLKLIDAGFSHEEILKMQDPEKPEPEKPEPEKPEQEKAEAEKPEPEKQADTGNAQAIVEMKKEMEKMRETIKALQSENAKGAEHEDEKEMSVDDVVQSFITGN